MIRILTAAAAILLVTAAYADDVPLAKITPVFGAAIPNIPGKSLKSVTVEYGPGGRSGSHTHAKSAFIWAYVLEGAFRSKVDDGPERVYREGEFWTENPGAHHVVSANASDTEPAKLLAVFVVDTRDTNLTVPDHQ
ncbi:cupin domain-containing protein [Chelatococcus sambhunathii]|uniref:Cupin domain-containing protein n=1 Tax=Chelatococcus sambhunathii TaxID=363953 RepID=A0ABU1DGQ9_9HYPH|nr:cupin domain-containing protein [Chelatococcus sambhunathii]MDR4307189.1 cupin domain-containing protein [Chelatococcus sambhunathii]